MLGNDVVHPPELADRIAAGSLVQRWLMALSGVLLGSVTAVSALLFTVVALLVLTPARLLGRWGEPVRAAVDEGALGLSEWEIR